MVITIGGGYGCGAKRVAEIAAKALGYKFCNDEVIEEEVKNTDVDLTEEAYRYYEESEGTASVSDIRKVSNTLHNAVFCLSKDIVPLDKKMDKLQRDVLNKIADEDNCIILGRCASYYLSGRKNLLTFFFVDTEDHCISRIMDKFSLSREDARKLIVKTNKRRKEYHEYFTDRTWGDPENYDFFLKCGILGEEGSAEMVEKIIQIRDAQLKKQ